MVGPTKIFPQRKNAFDNLAFPSLQRLGHIAPPPDRPILSGLGDSFGTTPWKGIWLGASILPRLPALSTAPQTSSFSRFQSDTLGGITGFEFPRMGDQACS